jgi:quinol monooxygenase YgiN
VIHVIAEILLRPGARDAFVAEFQRLTPLVRAEDGCIEYQGALESRTAIAAQAPVRDDVLTVVEKWRDEAALAAHLDAAHMHDHRERSRDLAAGVTVRVLRSV